MVKFKSILTRLQPNRSTNDVKEEENLIQKQKFRIKLEERKIFIILIGCHIAVFIRSLAISLQHTVFPYYAKNLGVKPQVYGYLGSSTAILQLIGGPICGCLGDTYGGRAVLISSFIALGSSYVLTLMAQNIPMLFLSRLPLFASHVTQSVQIIVTDVTSSEERADMFGKIGVTIGVGMISGSLIAGYISEIFGMRWPYIIAIVIVCIGAGLVISLVPKDTKTVKENIFESPTNHHSDANINKNGSNITSSQTSTGELLCNSIAENESKTENCDYSNSETKLDENVLEDSKKENDRKTLHDDDTDANVSKKVSNIKNIFKEMCIVLKSKHFMYLIIIKFLSDLPSGINASMFSIIIMEYYKQGPKVNGMVLAYGSIIGIITQGFLVGLLTRYYSDANLIMFSFTLLAIGSLFLIVAHNIFIFCIVLVLLAIGGFLLLTIFTALITKVSKKNRIGSVLGVTHCAHALIRVISPTTGGFLFENVGFFSFGLLGYIMNSILLIYVAFYGTVEFT